MPDLFSKNGLSNDEKRLGKMAQFLLLKLGRLIDYIVVDEKTGEWGERRGERGEGRDSEIGNPRCCGPTSA
jgi:hypothetical protein